MKTPAFFLAALFTVIGSLRAADAPGMLRVLTYDRTIPREVCLQFTEKTGVPVDITTAISSSEAADILYRKKEPFDLVVLANDVVRALRDRGLLLPLERKKIANFSKLNPQWTHAAGDPRGDFRIPLEVASIGLLVDRRVPQPEVRGYMDAFRKLRPGGVAVMVDQRDLLAVALLSLGASVNELTADNLRAARVILTKWLQNIAPASKEIWSSSHDSAFNKLRAGIVEGRHGAALLYSGDAIALMTEFPDRYEWINPIEGSLKYMTICAIPKNALRPDAAHKFIDFILDPRIASQVIVAPGFGIHLNAPWAKIPMHFHGHPADITAGQMLDHFSVQADITREPRQELEDFYQSLPAPSAPVSNTNPP